VVTGPEPEPKVGIEAVKEAARREATEKIRHDLESQFGKKISETQRQERERARQEREQLLTGLSTFVPDEELKRAREQYTLAEQRAEQEAELANLKAYAAQKQAEDRLSLAAAEAQNLVQEAGYKFEDLPKDVLGASPEGFKERFATHVIKENAKLKKEMDAAVKKAAEDATRETERKLGVTKVSGSEPVGSGKSRLTDLREQLRAAHDRNDEKAIRELGNRIEEEVYRK
jgi:hypothetical protein